MRTKEVLLEIQVAAAALTLCVESRQHEQTSQWAVTCVLTFGLLCPGSLVGSITSGSTTLQQTHKKDGKFAAWWFDKQKEEESNEEEDDDDGSSDEEETKKRKEDEQISSSANKKAKK